MFNKFLIVMTISILSLYGCGGGNGGVTTTDTTTGTDTPTPTDTSLVFSIFAPEYFDVDYSASYSLAGSDTNGDSYTATQTVTAGAVEVYSVPPKPVKEIIVKTSIVNTSTNAPIDILDKKYFTSEANYSDLRLLASENLLGFSAINTVDYIIPLTATIGEGGTIGEFFRANDSSSFTQSWKLTDGFNGKAKLIVTTVPHDTTSDLYPTTIEKLLISQDGTVSGYELIITYHLSGNTITLTSL